MSSIVESALPEPVAGQRIEYWEWIEQHAVPSMRDTLMVLREHWCDCNERYFDGRMVLPYITLTEPSAPKILGQCCSVSSWGSRLEIKLRPSLLEGTHPMVVRTGISAAGRLQFVKDVLLHEMIHQHVMEHEPDVNEQSYHGHGPVFAAHCNRIGAELGLDEVVVRNRKGSKSAKSPQWPHCVAPPDRYGAPLRWSGERAVINHDSVIGSVSDSESTVTDSGVRVPDGCLPTSVRTKRVSGKMLIEIVFEPECGESTDPEIRTCMPIASALELGKLLTEHFAAETDGLDAAA
jgi:hypothetical protein